MKTDIIVKSVMTKKPVKISSTKRWSAIKAVGIGLKAVLEENPKFRDGTKRCVSKLADSLSGVETVADSKVIGGDCTFNFYGEMEEQITTKTKSEDEQFKKMMDRCIARWDNSKKMKIAEQRNEALEEIDFSELEDDATFIHDDFSDDDSFFESDDADKFYCMDDDVFLPNIRGRHSSSDSFVPTPGNELTVGMRCSRSLITLEEITSGPGVPWHFGKWIDVGETVMPHFNFAQKNNLTTTAENIFSGILIANNSRQGIVSTGSQHFDHISLTRTSEDNCEKLQGSFVSFPTDGADREATKSCGSKAAKANTDGFLEESKEENSTTPAKSGENYFSKIWKENEVDEKDKFENEDSKRTATVGGSGDIIQEDELVSETFKMFQKQVQKQVQKCFKKKMLAPENFKMLENWSFDAEIAVADESVFGDVLDHSTAEELMLLDGQDGSGVDPRDVVSGLVQMKLEEPDRKKYISLNPEPQLTHSDVKNWKVSFFYAESDGIFGSDKIVESAIEWPLMLGQTKIFSAEVRKSSTTESDSEVLHVHSLQGQVIWS